MPTEHISVQCCIIGGGPAGMMLGLLLARAGIKVVVLEKHADFLRDFRGDTIHPSTLEIMHELGLLPGLLKLPHQKVAALNLRIGDELFQIADFTHLPTQCGYIAFMPQWDFLKFLADQAAHFPNFLLRMQSPLTGLSEVDGKVTGVRAASPAGDVEISADLVIGADGRHSIVREHAGLHAEDYGAPMDVLWFRLPKLAHDPNTSMGSVAAGHIFILIDRETYWQCGYVIAKGDFEKIQTQGLSAFRDDISRLTRFADDRANALQSWDDVKLLTVQVNRLQQWYKPGLLCIGDAAHAMSPIGGVGINLAIQDAVAAANALTIPLLKRNLNEDDLRHVQMRRELPTRAIQGIQLAMQKNFVKAVLGRTTKIEPPLAIRALSHSALLRRLPARLVGMGIRPEHIKSRL